MARNIIQNKRTIGFIIGCLMKEPDLLSDSRGYHIVHEDFPERFHKTIFMAIYNLYKDGAKEINIPEIDSYLKNYPDFYTTFNNSSVNGQEYLTFCLNISQLENFEVYHKDLKTYSILRFAQERGLSTKEFLDSSITDPKKINEMQKKLDETELEDILKFYEKQVSDMKSNFLLNNNENVFLGGHNIFELVNELENIPDQGYSLMSGYMNKAFRGFRKGKYYLASSPSGHGKTRQIVATILNAAASIKYDQTRGYWINNGLQHSGSIITTELDIDEIQTMCLAWLADIEEEKILDNKLDSEEKERIMIAAQHLHELGNNKKLAIEYLPEYDTNDVKAVIERHVIDYGIEYLGWDYIHTNAKILTSLGRARSDQALLLISTELKNQAKKHHIALMSATQLTPNNNSETGYDIQDAKSIINKADVGYFVLPATDKEKEAVGGFGEAAPTHVIHVNKNRRGSLNNIKIFVNYDLGTLKMRDCCVTKKNNEKMEKVKPLRLYETIEQKKKERVNFSEEVLSENTVEDLNDFLDF